MCSKMVVGAVSLVGFFCLPPMLSAQSNRDAEQDAQILQLRTDLKSLSDLVAEHGKNLTAITRTVEAQDGAIKKLKSDFDRTVEALRNESEQQQRILQAISSTDSRGNSVLKLLPIMKQSPEFRQEVSDAVHETMRQQGTLRVRSEMSTGTNMLVNGRTYYIPPYATIEIPVPVGTLTTELPGYEAPKNWTIGPPNYTQAIDIRPKSSPLVIVEPPPIVYAPVVVGPTVIRW